METGDLEGDEWPCSIQRSSAVLNYLHVYSLTGYLSIDVL